MFLRVVKSFLTCVPCHIPAPALVVVVVVVAAAAVAVAVAVAVVALVLLMVLMISNGSTRRDPLFQFRISNKTAFRTTFVTSSFAAIDS